MAVWRAHGWAQRGETSQGWTPMANSWVLDEMKTVGLKDNRMDDRLKVGGMAKRSAAMSTLIACPLQSVHTNQPTWRRSLERA